MSPAPQFAPACAATLACGRLLPAVRKLNDSGYHRASKTMLPVRRFCLALGHTVLAFSSCRDWTNCELQKVALAVLLHLVWPWTRTSHARTLPLASMPVGRHLVSLDVRWDKF